jgi:RND family efflux transporter MFP subunit
MGVGAGRCLLACVLAATISGCGEEEIEAPEVVRPIRTMVVTEVANGQIRKFTGLVEASDSSVVSFQVGGNVLDVQVNRGDQVTSGQILATLDGEPFELNVRAAEADLERARAELSQKRAEFERQRTLYEQGWVARARFDNAERDYLAAASQVDYTVARLNLANRDLNNATLAAPFSGTISSRSVDPFVEVQAGQELFTLEAEGGFDAVFGVPETSISEVTLGMPTTVRVPRFTTPLDALITEVGTTAGAGNTFTVKAALIDPPPDLRSGMTTEVTLLLAGAAEESGYLVPIGAIAPGEAPGEGIVFVYDPETSTVRRTVVTSAKTMVSNMAAVHGLKAGDVIATAGVNFLVDGQRVSLMSAAEAGS